MSDPLDDVLRRMVSHAAVTGNAKLAGLARAALELPSTVKFVGRGLNARPTRSEASRLAGEIEVIDQCLADEDPAPATREYLLERRRGLEERLDRASR